MIRWSTSDYPADPADGTLLVDQNDGLGNKGTFSHGGLSNSTTYYYSAFVDNGSGEYSARKTVSARPFDTSGATQWAYSTGASALAPPGIGSIYGVANDRVLHLHGYRRWSRCLARLVDAPGHERPRSRTTRGGADLHRRGDQGGVHGLSRWPCLRRQRRQWPASSGPVPTWEVWFKDRPSAFFPPSEALRT